MRKLSFRVIVTHCHLLLLSTVALAFCSGRAFGQGTGAESAGAATVKVGDVFSYQAPPGWKVLTVAGVKNPIATDPQQRDTSPFIQADTLASTTPLEEFVEANKQQMKKMVPSTEFLGQASFVTTAGLKGMRVVASAHPGVRDYKAVYYMFDGPHGTKVVIFANVGAAGFEKNEALFDAAIKTMVLP